MPRNRNLGAFGETFAAHHLARAGYDILARNVRYPTGEIDLVAREGDELVFLEVKTRRSTRHALPEDAIDEARLDHLESAITAYLEAHQLTSAPYRIEVVAIEVGRDGRVIRCEVIGDPGVR